MDFMSDIALALERNPGGWGTVLAVLYIGGITLYRFLRASFPHPGSAATVLFGLLAAVTGFYLVGLLIGPEEPARDEGQNYTSLIGLAPEEYAGLKGFELAPENAARAAADYEAALADRPLEVRLSTYGPDQKIIAERLVGEAEAAVALVDRVKAGEIGLARIKLNRQLNLTEANSYLPDLVEIEVMPGTWRGFEIQTGTPETVEIAAEPKDTLTIKADPRDPSGALLTLCADNPRYSGCTRRIDLPLIPPGEKLSIHSGRSNST